MIDSDNFTQYFDRRIVLMNVYSHGLRAKLPVMHAATTATLIAATVVDVTPNRGRVNVVAYSSTQFFERIIRYTIYFGKHIFCFISSFISLGFKKPKQIHNTRCDSEQNCMGPCNGGKNAMWCGGGNKPSPGPAPPTPPPRQVIRYV